MGVLVGCWYSLDPPRPLSGLNEALAVFIRNVNTYRTKDDLSKELIKIFCKCYCWNGRVEAVAGAQPYELDRL